MMDNTSSSRVYSNFSMDNDQRRVHPPLSGSVFKQNRSRSETKPTSLKQRLLDRVSSDEDLQNMTKWTPQLSTSTSTFTPAGISARLLVPPSSPPPSPITHQKETGRHDKTVVSDASTQRSNEAVLSPLGHDGADKTSLVEDLRRIDRSGFLHVAPLVTAHQPTHVNSTRGDDECININNSYQLCGMSKTSEAQLSSETMPVSDSTEVKNSSIVIKTESGCVPAGDEAVAASSSSSSSVSNNTSSSSSSGRGNKTKEVPGRNCAVCDDVASGYHYGVWSCEGCKAFFKRSIQGSAEYVCPATNECTIDKHRRKSCQACRLRKCYTVGMMRGGVRKDRKPGGRSKYKRPAEDGASGENGCPSKRVPTNPILIALVGAEGDPLFTEENINQNEQNYLMKTLINLADRQLLHVINWAKQIPGYTALELDDQVRLLENSWLEILLISLCYKSMQYKGEKLYFAPGLIVDKEDFVKSGFADLCQHIGAISSKCAAFNISKEEFVCLKALVLVNSAMDLQSQDRLHKLQDDLTDALSEAVELTNPTEMRRLPKLLMLLSHLRHLSCKGITQLFEARNSGNVPLYDLLLEMLDANTIVRRQQRQAQEWQQEIKRENDSSTQ